MVTEKSPFRFELWSALLVQRMLEEVDLATANDQHPEPKTRTTYGESVWKTRWPELLKNTIERRDPAGLAEELLQENLISDPNTAALIATQHFKRFYNAAICRLAIDAKKQVWYYRARQSDSPNPGTDGLLRHQERRKSGKTAGRSPRA